MSDRLKSLTDKIYAEGIEKAVAESETILAKAKEEAALLRADARSESEKIKADAEAEMVNHRKKVLAEIKLAARKSVNQLKQELHHLIEEEILTKPINGALKDNATLSRLLEITAGALQKESSDNWCLTVNDQQAEEIKKSLESQKQEILQKGISLAAGPQIEGGFVIEQENGHYKLVFDEATFTAFLGQFLKIETRNLLES